MNRMEWGFGTNRAVFVSENKEYRNRKDAFFIGFEQMEKKEGKNGLERVKGFLCLRVG